jgi:uncharacterized protein YjbI with pentapeptide repeats
MLAMTDETDKHAKEENAARKPWTVKEFGGKPLWDWLQLLIVPLVIAAIGFWFTASQNNRQQEIENQRAQQAQNIEDKRAKAERALAKQSAQDEALQAYLDQMSSLMLEKNLPESERSDAVYTLAQARTATVMTRLDSGRNKTVLGFLWNAGLVGENSNNSAGESVNLFRNIDLRGADLQGRSLREASLRGAILDHADLRGAILDHADLRGAYLGSTKLSDAIMSHADLSNATLFGADLKGAHLNDADLSGARLTSSASLAKFSSMANVEEVGGTSIQELSSARTLVGADRKDAADLSGADLSGSDLSDTFLGNADLTEADLTEVDLRRSVLINADLTDADLSDADLSAVYMTGVNGITPEQLNQQAKSVQGAVLPAGEFAADDFNPALSLRLSDGWAFGVEKPDDLALGLLGSSLLGPSQGELHFSSHIDHVFDPINLSEQTEVPAPENVDEWVSWFRQHPNLDTSKPAPVRVGGATGMRIDATLLFEPEDYSQDICGKQPCIPLYPEIRISKAYKERFIILDVKGETVIVDVTAASGGKKFDEFLPKAQKVLDTVEWKSQ